MISFNSSINEGSSKMLQLLKRESKAQMYISHQECLQLIYSTDTTLVNIQRATIHCMSTGYNLYFYWQNHLHYDQFSTIYRVVKELKDNERQR